MVVAHRPQQIQFSFRENLNEVVNGYQWLCYHYGNLIRDEGCGDCEPPWQEPVFAGQRVYCKSRALPPVTYGGATRLEVSCHASLQVSRKTPARSDRPFHE